MHGFRTACQPGDAQVFAHHCQHFMIQFDKGSTGGATT